MLLGIDQIRLGMCLRSANFTVVARLTSDLKRDGLKRPVLVMLGIERRPSRSDIPTYTLVTGGGTQRIAAARAIGWSEIEAATIRPDNYAAQLAEIDDTLINGDLTPLQQAEFLRARRELFAKVHQVSVGRGGDRRSFRYRNKAESAESFLSDTAGLMKFSVAYLCRAIRRAEAVDTKAKNLIGELRLNGSDLDRLVNLSIVRQRTIAAAIASGKFDSVKQALRES